MKKIFSLFMLTFLMSVGVKAQMPYTLVAPDNFNISIGAGGLINSKIGDEDFSKNYFDMEFTIGKYFNKSVGLSCIFDFATTGDRYDGNNLYAVGLDLNTRLTDYYAYSAFDLGLNVGLAYGRFEFKDTYLYSEGMDYVVPKIALGLIINLTPDKALQMVIEPSYKYYIATEKMYYIDNGEKVKGNIGALSILGKLKFNF